MIKRKPSGDGRHGTQVENSWQEGCTVISRKTAVAPSRYPRGTDSYYSTRSNQTPVLHPGALNHCHSNLEHNVKPRSDQKSSSRTPTLIQENYYDTHKERGRVHPALSRAENTPPLPSMVHPHHILSCSETWVSAVTSSEQSIRSCHPDYAKTVYVLTQFH